MRTSRMTTRSAISPIATSSNVERTRELDPMTDDCEHCEHCEHLTGMYVERGPRCHVACVAWHVGLNHDWNWVAYVKCVQYEAC